MVPLQDSDTISASTHSVFEHQKIIAPLHEKPFTAPRRVSFRDMVVNFPVMSRVDYTPEESKASWFDLDDMRRMKQNAKLEAKLMESGFLEHDTDLTVRGVENRTKEGIRRKRQNRMNAYAAVFSGIICQQEEEFFDEELVADAYFIYSNPCAITAQLIGKQDELDAMSIYENQKADIFEARFFHNDL